MEKKYTSFQVSYFVSPLFLALLLFVADQVWAQGRCEDLLAARAEISASASTTLQAISKPTLLETEFAEKRPPLEVQDQLRLELAKLQTQNAPLARKVREAIQEKSRGHSLKVDLSELSSSMIFFIEGPFAKVVGARGISKPFVQISKINENTLVIHHEGDTFPIMVRWSEGKKDISPVQLVTIENRSYQLLEIPAFFKTKKDMDAVPSRFIHALIAGSAMNKYINSFSSPIMFIAAGLHDGAYRFSRPTQAEAMSVREKIETNPVLRSRIKSLLFVAPTASGKTRVLGDSIVHQLENMGSKKVIVLATKTPDLTAELARNIGSQLYEEVGSKKYRLIQWGGELSENMNLTQLIDFIDRSPVPVVLFTSYPTLAARAPEAGQKENLMKRARSLLIDEAHNATGQTFTDAFAAATKVAQQNRTGQVQNDALDILGVTASPLTKTQRTIELYDGVFWAGVDKPGQWAQGLLKRPETQKASDRALEWIRMAEQYKAAWERGEINASEPIFYRPEERGFAFSSIFKRGDSGTQSSVHLERLKEIWPDIQSTVDHHGPGVIHTYPRDAEPVAEMLSGLTGKNFLSLQKLSIDERTKAYAAFRDQKPYNGKVIDAIVGTIREGLDFPQAGWYLSFKKYVKFPENIQGPGRVVRLALNKPSPVIMFFGHEVDRASYEDVKDLVMNRLGKLPRQLPEGRLYTGARRGVQREEMVKAIDQLNVAMEAFIRIHSEVAKKLGKKEALDADRIRELQELLKDMRSSSMNREIDLALNRFVFQVYSYPFFTGQLKSTWAFCDRMIALEKVPAEARGSKRMSDVEKATLANAKLMKLIKEFRGYYANIGPIPRALLEQFDLRLLNVTEVAHATNQFVENLGASPLGPEFSSSILESLVRTSMSISPEGFWRGLSVPARAKLSSELNASKLMSLEEVLNQYVEKEGKLPEYDLSEVITQGRDVTGNLEIHLAVDMAEKIREGSLEVKDLSVQARKIFEESALLAGFVSKMIKNIEKLKADPNIKNTYLKMLKDEGLFTYENLMLSSEMGLLKVIYDLQALNSSEDSPAQVYMNKIKEALRE